MRRYDMRLWQYRSEPPQRRRSRQVKNVGAAVLLGWDEGALGRRMGLAWRDRMRGDRETRYRECTRGDWGRHRDRAARRLMRRNLESRRAGEDATLIMSPFGTMQRWRRRWAWRKSFGSGAVGEQQRRGLPCLRTKWKSRMLAFPRTGTASGVKRKRAATLRQPYDQLRWICRDQ